MGEYMYNKVCKIKTTNLSNQDYVFVEVLMGPMEEPVEIVEQFDVNKFRKYIKEIKKSTK